MGGGAPDSALNRALAELVDRLMRLPPEEYLSTMVALIGPPPVKQPLVLEEVKVIEKQPLESGPSGAVSVTGRAPGTPQRGHPGRGAAGRPLDPDDPLS